MQITYGSVIKLMHEKTKFRLHSHDVPYGSGSGQQSVTGFPDVDDSNSYWVRILFLAANKLFSTNKQLYSMFCNVVRTKFLQYCAHGKTPVLFSFSFFFYF